MKELFKFWKQQPWWYWAIMGVILAFGIWMAIIHFKIIWWFLRK